jgi:hypothetical protein
MDVFDIRTEFMVVAYVPILPMRSYVCLLQEARLTRRSRLRAASVPASAPGQPPLLEYSQAGRSKMVVAAKYPLPHNVWRSVLAGYRRSFAVLAIATSVCVMVGFIARSPLGLQTALGTLALAMVLLLSSTSGASARISYEHAVRLAARARVPDAILQELQLRYGRSLQGRLIYGLPVSSTLILYAYADCELDDKAAGRIAAKIGNLALGRNWVFPEVWPINRWTTGEDQQPQRDLGLVLTLPTTLPEAWQRDLGTLIARLERLARRHQVGFAVGGCDLQSGANQDLMVVNGSATDMELLVQAVRQWMDAGAQAPMGTS